MSVLPKGWAEVPMSEVASWGSGGTPSRSNSEYYGGSIPWIKTGELGGRFVFDTEEKITELGLKNSSAKLFEKGSVAIAMYGATIGKTSILAIDATTNQACGVGKPIEGITTSEYLYHYLSSQKDAFIEAGKGGAQPNISQAVIKSWPIPLAPLPEQKRIADKLDATLARVDACRARLERVAPILKRFRQSVLAAATSGQLTADWREQQGYSRAGNDDKGLQGNTYASNVDWADEGSPTSVVHDERSASQARPELQAKMLISSLSPSGKSRRGVVDTYPQVSEYINSWHCPEGWWKGTAASLLCRGVLIDLKDGNHGANHPVVSDFTQEGVAFITAAQVNNYKIDYDGAYKIQGVPLEKLRVGFAKKDDVILTHKGSVGRLAIADRDCVLTPQTTYYRVNNKFIVPKYLMFYMASQPFTGQLDDIKSQTTRDFVPITQQYGLVHLIPSLQEQTEIVRRVETLFAFADRLEAHLGTASAAAERLTPSLLAKAFRGELVPQDPTDEPASELLKRLAAQREAAGSKPKRSKKASA